MINHITAIRGWNPLVVNPVFARNLSDLIWRSGKAADVEIEGRHVIVHHQVKAAEQQGQLMLHRTRDLLMRQRTQVINALRAHMAELGIVAAQGREGIKDLLKIIASEEDARLPVDARTSLVVLAAGLQALQTMIGSIRSGRFSAPLERGEQEARDHPWHWGYRSQRDSSDRPGSEGFSIRSRFGSLDWAGTARRFNWRQTEARTDLQTGRPLFAPRSGGWSPRRIETRAAAAGEVSLAHTTSRPQTVQGRGGGAGQQDGAHRLGVAGQGRHLSGAFACGSDVRSSAAMEG